jgi:hypothetical protein
MVVRDHDRFRHSRANKSSSVVHHGEVDVKANLFPVVATVASDAKRENHGSSRKVQNFSAVELDDVGGVFVVLSA